MRKIAIIRPAKRYNKSVIESFAEPWMKEKEKFSRCKFISNGTLGSIGILATAPLFGSCSGSKSPKKKKFLTELLDQAPDGKIFKAGLIGCGARGSGAAINFLDTGPNLQITALGDVFQDKIDNCRAKLKQEKNVEIADENCFIGFDSYEKVIDSGVDLVLLCTPPHFRPAHVEDAVNARKHIFMEKPIAVDPVGVRSVLASAKKSGSNRTEYGERDHSPGSQWRNR